MTRRMYCHESRKWVIYQKCSPTTLLLQVFTTHNFAQTTQYDGADHAPRCCSPRWSSSPHSRQRSNAMRIRDCRLPRPKKVWLSLTPELTGPLLHWSAGYARGDHRRRPSTSAKSFTEVLNGLVRGSTNIRTMCAERGCRTTVRKIGGTIHGLPHVLLLREEARLRAEEGRQAREPERTEPPRPLQPGARVLAYGVPPIESYRAWCAHVGTQPNALIERMHY